MGLVFALAFACHSLLTRSAFGREDAQHLFPWPCLHYLASSLCLLVPRYRLKCLTAVRQWLGSERLVNEGNDVLIAVKTRCDSEQQLHFASSFLSSLRTGLISRGGAENNLNITSRTPRHTTLLRDSHRRFAVSRLLPSGHYCRPASLTLARLPPRAVLTPALTSFRTPS